jgi:peptidoglycan hydrolase-like protein with peptidoglycan-binding domain
MFKKPAFDPGHKKGSNVDPKHKNYSEGTQMWNLVQNVFKLIKGVFITKNSCEENVGLEERVKRAKKAGCDILISTHSNYPHKGIVIYISMFANQEVKDFATELANRLSKALGIANNGVKTRKYPLRNADYYGINRYGEKYGIPSIIVEHGAHEELAVDTEKKLNIIASVYSDLLNLPVKVPKCVERIKILQYWLNMLGYRDYEDKRLDEDGVIGERTLSAIKKLPVLKKGSKKKEVKLLQIMLNYFGYKLDIDGSFGSATLKAVLEYQKVNGLEVDGSVGKHTWASFC